MVADFRFNYAPRDTGRGIVLHKNKILLIERWRDGLHYFSIPGGGIEEGETPEEAATREIHEETSIKVKTERLVLVMQDGAIQHHIYLCEYLDGEPQLHPDAPEAIANDPNNRFEPCWVPLTEDLETLLFTYWAPIEPALIEGLKHGFPDEPIVVTASQK
ncbi:MAG: NUDIX domain-containing protein [Candidatus Saccharimonadales bacterium]